MSIKALVISIDLIALLGFTTTILWWAGVLRNYSFYAGKSANAFFGSVILCRARLILSFEILGILLLIIKLSTFGADQTDYNEQIANALLYGTHATSEIYRTLREDIPLKMPDSIDATKADLPKTLGPGDKASIYKEVDVYVRKASRTLSDYFGQKIPECHFRGSQVRVLTTAPDAELVNFELARLSREKGLCDEVEVSKGISAELLYRSLKETGIEVLGGVFVALAIVLKILEILEKERTLKNPRLPKEWYWDESRLRF